MAATAAQPASKARGAHPPARPNREPAVSLEPCLCEFSEVFDVLLQGRDFQEAPDTTARMCGTCPIAYQMSAVQALEKVLGITVSPAIQTLRRLFYCAEWIENHSLYVYLIHVPELLGYENALAMAENPQLKPVIEQGLRLKEIGVSLRTLLGGRELHPISPCVGGFYYTPRQRHLLSLKDDMEWGLQTAIKLLNCVAGLPFPHVSSDCEFVALSHPEEYAMNEGCLVSSQGLNTAVEEFRSCFVKESALQGGAPHVRRVNGATYQVGPLARMNLNQARLSTRAGEALRASGLTFPSCNPAMSIAARAVELVYAFEEALHIIERYHQPVPSRVPAPPQAGEGSHVTEAPHGMMYQRYRLDRQGLIREVRIVAPTIRS